MVSKSDARNHYLVKSSFSLRGGSQEVVGKIFLGPCIKLCIHYNELSAPYKPNQNGPNKTHAQNTQFYILICLFCLVFLHLPQKKGQTRKTCKKLSSYTYLFLLCVLFSPFSFGLCGAVCSLVNTHLYKPSWSKPWAISLNFVKFKFLSVGSLRRRGEEFFPDAILRVP